MKKIPYLLLLLACFLRVLHIPPSLAYQYMKGVTNMYKITHLVINNNHSINQTKLLFTNKILITLSPFDPFPSDCEIRY